MLLGKLGDAAKKINNDDAIKGVHVLDSRQKTNFNRLFIVEEYKICGGFRIRYDSTH